MRLNCCSLIRCLKVLVFMIWVKFSFSLYKFFNILWANTYPGLMDVRWMHNTKLSAVSKSLEKTWEQSVQFLLSIKEGSGSPEVSQQCNRVASVPHPALTQPLLSNQTVIEEIAQVSMWDLTELVAIDTVSIRAKRWWKMKSSGEEESFVCWTDLPFFLLFLPHFYREEDITKTVLHRGSTCFATRLMTIHWP